MIMNKTVLLSAIYAEPKTFFPYGKGQIIGYFDEEIVENWHQDNVPENTPAITGYKYSGTRDDGGTILDCSDPSDYGELTNAIIRRSYSMSEEMAIHRHYSNSPEEYEEEWGEYNLVCEAAKELAKKWLGIV